LVAESLESKTVFSCVRAFLYAHVNRSAALLFQGFYVDFRGLDQDFDGCYGLGGLRSRDCLTTSLDGGRARPLVRYCGAGVPARARQAQAPPLQALRTPQSQAVKHSLPDPQGYDEAFFQLKFLKLSFLHPLFEEFLKLARKAPV